MDHLIFIYFLLFVGGSFMRLFDSAGRRITKLQILNIFNPLNGFYFLGETCWVIGFLIKKFWNLPLK